MTEQIELMNYTKKEEVYNTVTHAAGLLLALTALVALLAETVPTHEINRIVTAVVYPFAMFIMYGASTLYHGLPGGKLKRLARVVDHSMVSIMIAGTATPCALVTLYKVSLFWSLFVFIIGWLSAAVCVATAFLCFNRTRALRMVLYIVSGTVMFMSVIPTWKSLNKLGVFFLFLGCVFYLIGLYFIKKGQTVRYMHSVFHLFTLAGSLIHFIGIYYYVFG